MNKKFSVLKFVLISLFMLCSGSGIYAEDDRTVISIDNAKTTRYAKAEDRDTDIIILSGDVKISVSRGGTKNVISADEIRYDRASEMMYAEGNVSLEQTGTSSGGMNVTATSLMFNTSTLEGVFDDGRVVQTKSNALNLPSGSTLVVASDIFGRSESNTIAFKDGVLTFCSDEDPHWKIRASRIWLLPGGEFAFFNAFLFVGIMPVLWLPAFYYPKDELIFNPVIGYDNRKGYFVQTTTYLYGRKPLSTSSSSSSSSSDDGSEKLKALFNFIKPTTLKDQVREGLVYHNLDTDYKGDTSNYLKILGDYYSNLGGMVGVEGVFKPKKIVNSLETNLKFGFSNTVRQESSSYYPYFTDGVTVYDHSYLFGQEIPFRYSGNLKFSISKPFTFSMSLPFYSDPYFTQDFATDREESMDWISFLMTSLKKDDDDTTTSNEVSSYTWTGNGSYSIPLPSVIKPYINTASVSFSSDIKFSSKATSSDSLVTTVLTSESDLASWKSYTPQRKFYYPSQLTPATVTGTISGTILDYSSSKTAAAKTAATPKFVLSLVEPDELLTEQERKEAEKKAREEAEKTESENNADKTAAQAETADESTEEEKVPLPKEALPSLTAVSGSVTTAQGLAASIKYSVKPNLTTQLNYAAEALDKAADFSFDKLKSFYYKLQIPVTLDNSLSYGGSFFSLSNNWSYTPVFVDHPYVHINTDSTDKIGVTEDSAKSSKATDYASCKQDLTNTNSVSFKPFTNISLFKDTGITYRNTVKVIRTSFNTDEYKSSGNAIWEYDTAGWDKDSITTHALDFVLASNQLDNKFSQSLTVTTTLKPQTEQYYATLKLVFPYVTAGFETGVKADTTNEGEWIKQPLKQSLSVSLFNSALKFSESYSYNLADETPHHDSFKANVSWKNLSLAYVMSYTTDYELNTTTGWKALSTKSFRPYTLSLSYSLGNKTLYAWKNRVSIGFNFSTAVNADLVRYTNSSFTFTPTLSLKIQDFVTFSFSSTSKNSSIFSYFMNNDYKFGDITVDLLNGFAFGNEDLRRQSSFKLKSMNFSVTHELHDWDFSGTFKMEPRLVSNDDGTKEYKLDPYITIAISWRPMSSLKTEIIDKYGEWALQ